MSGMNFVSSSILPGVYTVDTLPPPVDNLDTYARVSDLFGEKRDLVLASRVGSTSFWQPVRPTYASNMPIASNMTLTAMKNASVIFLTGTLPGLGGNRDVTLSNSLAFPGASFRIKNNMSGLGTLRILGLNLGSILSTLLGGTNEFVYDISDGWKQIS